ncbi:heterokaryon incompatibility protein-domain-containing protein [Phyllosticta capitalensis]
MLCALCIINAQEGNHRRGRPHHKTLSDFLKAADGGCQICSRLKVHLEDTAAKIFLTEAHYVPAICLVSTDMLKFIFPGSFPDEDNWHLRPEFAFMLHPPLNTGGFIENKGVWPPPTNPDDHFGTEDTLAKADVETQPWKVRVGKTIAFPSNTGDPAVLDLARDWLRTCQDEHSLCTEMVSKSRDGALSKHPKRLIDLSNFAKSSGNPFLIETREHELQGPYATLSHCWGTKEFITLTENNIGDMLTEIPMDQLPKSFQDAITVCVRLKIQYLWIDSLCIIQAKAGINQDWIEHARTMADIYRNCVLNIAIDRASNPFEGAFVERDIGLLQPGRVTVPCTGVFDHESCFETKFFASAEKDEISVLEELPLSKRGWTFQERFCSPRVLHFGQDRIYWECFQSCMSDVSESYGHNVGEMSTPFNYFNGRDWEESFFRWKGIVQGYTDRLFTKPDQDKLVAFAAIAQEFERQTKTRIVAGLFEGNLKSLLWTTNFCDRERKRSREYQAPSWSWANADSECEIYHDWDGPKFYFEILNTDMEYVDPENRHGMVQSGILTIKGHIAPFEWEEIPSHGLIITRISDLSTLKEAEKWELTLRTDFDDDFEAFDNREKILLRIRPRAGLMLVKTEVKDTYLRVGRFTCWDQKDYTGGDCSGDMHQHIADRFDEQRVIKIV